MGSSHPVFVFGTTTGGAAVLEEADAAEIVAAAGETVAKPFTMSVKAPTTIAGTLALSFHGLLKRIMSSVGPRSNPFS